jgi:hypothetical protein
MWLRLPHKRHKPNATASRIKKVNAKCKDTHADPGAAAGERITKLGIVISGYREKNQNDGMHMHMPKLQD